MIRKKDPVDRVLQTDLSQVKKKKQIGIEAYRVAISCLRRADEASERQDITGLELLNYVKASEVAFEVYANVTGIPRRPQTKGGSKLMLEMVESEPIQEIDADR